MAGEMTKEDIEEGGEHWETRKEMEDIARKAGVVIKVEPFDVYQGPKGIVHVGALNVGTLWSRDDRWEFIPTTEMKLKQQIKPSKFPKPAMIYFLKHLTERFPSHKPFDVLKGDKPSNYQTPALKKAQQKSLLKLVKSKYIIKIKASSK